MRNKSSSSERTWNKPFLVAMLFLSGILVSVYSATTPIARSPDERHHFAYAYGIYKQNLNPLFDRSLILSDGDDLNHLRHPPAYYFIIASAMYFLDIDKDFRNLGVPPAEYEAALSRSSIPVLRKISIFLYFISLFGVYKLITLLTKFKFVSGFHSILVASLILYIPSRLHIAGTVNNDALVVAVWPYMAYYCIKSVIYRNPSSTLLLLTTSMIGVLTKVTMLIVAFPLVIIVLLFLSMKICSGRQNIYEHIRKWKNEISNNRLSSIAVLSIFMIILSYFSVYFVTSLIKYGSINPTYTQIYQISDDDNKFKIDLSDEEKHARFPRWIDMATSVIISSWRTTTGVFGHGYLYVESDIRIELILIITAVFISLLNVVFIVIFGKQRKFITLSISLTFISIPILFYYVWIDWNWSNWATNGRIGVQGRYTIGAVELGLIGVFVTWSGWRLHPRHLVRAGGALGGALIFLFLAPALFKPLLYARMNEHLYFSSNMPRTVERFLKEGGYSKLELVPVSPPSMVRNSFVGEAKDSGHKNFFRILSARAKFSAKLKSDGLGARQAVSLAVWTRGGELPIPLRLELRGSLDEDHPIGSDAFYIGSDVGITKKCFEINGFIDDELTVYLMVSSDMNKNHTAVFNIYNDIIRRGNSPILLGVYAKAVDGCVKN